jgi:hypothetical protein
VPNTGPFCLHLIVGSFGLRAVGSKRRRSTGEHDNPGDHRYEGSDRAGKA